VASVAAVTSAIAVVSNAFRYSPAQFGYYSISALNLGPRDFQSATNYTIDFTEGSLATIGGGTACFSTGVNLPNGAVVRRLVVWFASSDAVVNGPTVRLNRYALSNGAIQSLVAPSQLVSDTGDRLAAAFNVSSSFATVNNATHAYGLGVCLNTGDGFYQARIDYTYTSAGD
jgi:hypothetical protein